MEIDKAFERFAAIRGELLAIAPADQTEADTRALVVDRLLAEVLGWRPGQIAREEIKGSDRIDYKLSATTEFVAIEAKKTSIIWEIPASEHRWYKRSGPVCKGGELAAAIDQAGRYASRWGCGLACATNGIQWVFFLTNRNDGVADEDGYILVFRSLEEIATPEIFRLFFGVIGEVCVRSSAFREPFLVQEGSITQPTLGTSKRLIDVLKAKNQQRKRSEIAKALAPILREVFEGLSSAQNPEALRACFVETRESEEANNRLERIAKELTEDIEAIDTRDAMGSDKLVDIINAESDAMRSSNAASGGSTVLILGQHGAGKSTFIDVFFEQKLSRDMRDKCLVVRIDLAKADPDPKTVPAFLRTQTLQAVLRALYDGGVPSFDELKGIFFDEYTSLAKGALKPLRESNPTQFEIEFGQRLEKLAQDEAMYLGKILRHVRSSRRKLACVVFDNADHFSDDFQRAVFMQAQWVTGLSRLLLLLPLRDTTYWRARQQSAFHAVRNTVLYLPRPPLHEVLNRRFSFAIGELGKGERTSLKSAHGFRIAVQSPAELLTALQRAFISDTYISRVIHQLSGGDIREALRLFEECVSSPHIPLDKLLSAYLLNGQYAIGRSMFDRAAMLGEWENFSHERSRRICNLLCCPRDSRISPLLGFRVLMRCYELREQELSEIDKGFESVDNLLSYFTTMGVQRAHTDRAIGELLYAELLEPYDLGSVGADFRGETSKGVGHVRITPSGNQHRRWMEESRAYGTCMSGDVQIFDDDLIVTLLDRHNRKINHLIRQEYDKLRAMEVEIASLTSTYVLARDAEHVMPHGGVQATVSAQLCAWTRQSMDDEVSNA